MAAINFPDSPSNGDTHVVDGVTYTYNSAETKWKTTINSNAFLPLSGGTVSGNLSVSGDVTVDTNTLYVDSTNNRVGLGTANPEAPFHVESAGETIAIIEGNSTIGAVLGLKNNSTTANHYSQIQGVDAGGQTVSAINFYNADNANNEGFITALTRPSGGLPTEVFRLDSSGNLKFNSGYGSVATAYGVRAWVNFNASGTLSIRGSGNISSVTDNGVGQFAPNFTNAMPDTNYAGVCSHNAISGGNDGAQASPNTTSAALVQTGSAGAWRDPGVVCVAFFR